MGRKPKPLRKRKVILTLRVLPAVKRALERAARADSDTVSHVAEVTLTAMLRERGLMKRRGAGKAAVQEAKPTAGEEAGTSNDETG